MKIAALSQLKAQLSSFIRIVKAGEIVEVQERGIPVAYLKPIESEKVSFIPARSDPTALSRLISKITPPKDFDVAEMLSEDRRRR
jgi:antitoxin (DNA-binding transcriptional repressor) of toxin-antitoxin stability system